MRAQMLVFLVVTAGAVAGPAAADGVQERTSSTPFRATRPGEVIVPVTVGGRGPYRFLLDTGSTHTVVTAALADAVDARLVARTEMRSAAGTLACLVVALPPLAVGDAVSEGLTATALPLQAAGALGRDVDGVLGQDFLARFAFTIDYRRSRIVWHAADFVPSGVRLALIPAQGRWMIELPQPGPPRTTSRLVESIADPRARPGPLRTLRLVPDSGADTLVLFGEARARSLRAEWGAGTAELGSLTGVRAVRTATVDGLRVGDAILDRQLAAIVPATTGEPADAAMVPANSGAHAGAPADAEADALSDADPSEPDGLLPLHLFASVFFSARSRALVIEPR